MSEQRPKRPGSGYFRTPSNRPAEQMPRTPVGAYFRQPGSEPAPASVPSGSVILGLDTDTGHPVYVSQLDLCSGTYIVGMPGMGKSSLLEQIIYQQMQRDEAIIVIDAHGDLVNSVLAHMPEQKLSKTYLLDLKDRKYPFGLNIFACEHPDDEEEQDATRNQLTHAFEKLWPTTSGQLYFNMLLRHLVNVLIEQPTLTLADAPALFRDAALLRGSTVHLRNSRSREFWEQEYPSIPDSYKRPLLDRLDRLLSERVLAGIIKQRQKTLSIRTLIAEKNILLVKLPVLEPAYAHAAEVVGTLLMAMVYSATFSFNALPHDLRPGFTLIVDEFENFVTDEYATLFEQGRKDKAKQVLAHQQRQQLERGQKQTGRTNLAATLSAHTIIAFRTAPKDSRELASLYTGIAERHRPTDIAIHPLEKINDHKHPTVKHFVLDVVDRLKDAAGLHVETKREYYTEKRYRHHGGHGYTEEVPRSFTYKENPTFDFGQGEVAVPPAQAKEALRLLGLLIYESEAQRKVPPSQRQEFIDTVAPFWKLDPDGKIPDPKHPAMQSLQRNPRAAEKAQALERLTRFEQFLDTVLAILIDKPIAEDAELTSSDIAELLEHLEQREKKREDIPHALVKTGSTAYQMDTRDTRLLQEPTTAEEAERRLTQVRRQTRARYCIPRTDLDEREAEEKETTKPPLAEPQSEQELIQTEILEPEPIRGEREAEPAIQTPAPPAYQEPEQPQPERIPAASRDGMNMLYAQLQAKAIDPDTTILAALGEHYVLTIRQWMRLFELKSYPKATPYFKILREQGYIYRKDREGRGGALVTGDWFFLLTKGANELARRKQPAPIFKLEPNEAEKAAGDTLFHTYLVNEVLIHLRLLERHYPGIITIERIDHERSMRREYLAALGSDAKLYPDGFLRLLVPTLNGLRKRYLFLELQHTTQKDKQNWQSKVRKYLDLFSQESTLTHYFATKTPRVLILVMDEEYRAYHKQWTEEVLKQAGDKGKGYSNRFLVGSFDKGIADNTMQPLRFFCTDRFFVPLTDTTHPLFYRMK